ncbi:hypothetical protein [Qipengyuania nanhaisediminis]|uniref:Uncharacterized protein n=1 Tax=Qipengyuania nanhaisediminis TaxID=604088 RepID=A0A1I5MHW6_9SPHN|nr:hypothetical protein [Qipengyuania nanhaisediminis]SFP09175.1 hypothetical protein SAMN04488060_1377 [Qipengyuania nanhaisediminis]
MTVPEWKLEDAADKADSYQFKNTNPKLVFLLALAAGLLAVAIIFFAYVIVSLSIDVGLIPQPPRLRGLVD